MAKTKLIFSHPLEWFIGEVSIKETKEGALQYYVYVDPKESDNYWYTRRINRNTAKSMIEQKGCQEWECSVTGKHNKNDVLNKYFNYE